MGRSRFEASGNSRQEIEHAGRMIATSKRVICTWAMGLTQHRAAGAGIQYLDNLLLLGGHKGRQGAGTCCVRGHSNVQGDRTMGIFEHVDGPFLDRLEARFGFQAPRRPGLDTVAAIAAMAAGQARVFVALGGHFLSATPDTERTAAAPLGLRFPMKSVTRAACGGAATSARTSRARAPERPGRLEQPYTAASPAARKAPSHPRTRAA
jgi:anaerobic selenocysteine-containing dehydrogenase